MQPSKKVLPQEVRFSHDACLILADVNSHLHPNYQELLARYPHADGLRDIAICQSAAPTDAEALIEAVREGRYSYICIGWLVFITAFANAARRKGMDVRDYADWIYDQCRRINGEVGYRAAWIEAYGEIGNSITWPQGSRMSKQEALRYFREWFRSGRMLTEHWRSVSPAETINFYTHAKRQDENLRKLPIYYSEGTIFTIHEVFRMGVPFVAYEGACGSRDSFQTGIAFVRGGAKQFDALWGVDLSPWGGGPAGNVAETNNAGVWRAGMTPDFFHRVWLTSYLSGCNTLLHEVGYCFFYTWHDGEAMLSDYGYRAMDFYRQTRGVLADRGRAVTPFAIMLEEEHGYHGSTCREYTPEGALTEANDETTPQGRLNIWANRVAEATPGDWQVHRTIEAIWPWSENLWAELHGGCPDEKQVDWGQTQPELPAMLGVGEVDPRSASAGYLRDSTWADCFDVVTEDASAEVLARYYKAVMLAGDVRTDNGLWDRLKRFAEQGGQTILTVEQLDATARGELGLEHAVEPKAMNVNRMTAANATWPVKERLTVHSVAAAGWSVWAADEKTSQPLVLQRSVGRGGLYLVLCANGMDRDGTKLSAVVRTLIDTLYARHVGVTKHGAGCQMIINARERDTLVTLMNHTGSPWRGQVVFGRKDYPKVDEVRDPIADAAYPPSLVQFGPGEVTATVCIPPFGVKVLSFGPQREAEAFRGPLTTTGGLDEGDVAYLEEIKRRGPKDVLGTVEDYDRRKRRQDQ
ncbi:MAG: hypothetical protein GXY33_04355 [Phycisphaerae bacterium]|nr:hypothetical protein [Phycisphaerae bacterium]